MGTRSTTDYSTHISSATYEANFEHPFVDYLMLDQPVGAFFVVSLFVTEVVLFPIALLFLRVAVVVFLVLPRVVRVVAFFAFVDDLPFVDGVWERSEEFFEVVPVLRVPLGEDVPFCAGFSPATWC